MRLYRLELQAIGPFAGHHAIDFAALGRSGLFLLEGPTGAGKSTVIDAVVFALYGDLAGAESSKQRLHSHHAEPGVEPFVDLVFEVEAGLFRIRRSPAHERPKKRGTGTTPVNATVTLTRLHDVDRPDHGDVVSTSNQEAGDEIGHLVGLNRTQFLQTVVLPQGEFATFLRSSGEDRKKLLEKIFRTHVYERITVELVDRRRAAMQATEAARTELATAARVVAEVAEVDVEAIDPAALTAEVDQRHVEAMATVQAATAVLDAARRTLSDAEATVAALARRADLVRRTARLETERPAIEQAVERIGVARRAALVVPYRDSARAAAAELERTVALHRAAVEQAPTGLDPADCDAEVDRLTAELRDLTDLARLEAGLADRQSALDEHHDRRAQMADRRAEKADQLAGQPARRAEVDTRLTALRARLAHRGALEAAVGQAEAGLLAARDAEAAETELLQRADLVKELHGNAASALQIHTELRLARIDGMAGELASRLVVGESCMVCGSDSHPHPARRGADHPDEQAVDVAERRARDAETSFEEARTAHVVLEQQVAHLRDRAGGLDVAAATAHRDSATAALTALDEVQADHDDTVAELEQVDADTETFRALTAELDSRLATLDEQIRHSAESLAADRTLVDAAAATEPIVSTVERLQAEREAVRRLRDTAAARTSAERSDAIAAGDLEARLVEHHFASVDDVDRSTLATPDLERLEHQVTTHREDQARVEEGWADPSVAALIGDEQPDVAGATAACDAAAAEHEAAVGLARVADRRRTQVLGALTALTAATAALVEAEADAAAVIRLAGLADASSPENLKKLTLGTYVLLRRFVEVVDAANARLGAMSDGRYQLRVADEREKSSSGRRTGLALSVLDADTGREREPRTLSGGETFYVSLCLALGLADVVSAESGGVRLDTLFVDEGFGSLDPQTLDAVMAELGHLAANGRAVGLVSHVEELKQRVADRIEVRRAADGVSTLDVLA